MHTGPPYTILAVEWQAYCSTNEGLRCNGRLHSVFVHDTWTACMECHSASAHDALLDSMH